MRSPDSRDDGNGFTELNLKKTSKTPLIRLPITLYYAIINKQSDKPSQSSGLGPRPLTAVSGVRIPMRVPWKRTLTERRSPFLYLYRICRTGIFPYYASFHSALSATPSRHTDYCSLHILPDAFRRFQKTHTSGILFLTEYNRSAFRFFSGNEKGRKNSSLDLLSTNINDIILCRFYDIRQYNCRLSDSRSLISLPTLQ